MKKLIAIAICAWVFASCTEGFEEMNIDPNNPSTAATPYLLTNAQKTIADQLENSSFNGWQGMQYVQYWASNQYTNESRYQERPEVNNGAWNAFYAGALADLQEIIRLNTELPGDYERYGDNNNQIAVAKILRVYVFQMMTDLWGDIPYSQALDPDNYRLPAYDAQEDIYNGLLTEIDEAIALINTGASGFVSGDIVYGGDMAKWKKFANSLKLRLAIRIADRDATKAGAAIQAAVASGVISSNDENALFTYLVSVPNNNPLNQNRKTRVDFAVSEALVNALVARNDPRLPAYADPRINGGGFRGIPYGLTEAEAGAIPVEDISQPSGANEMAAGNLTPAKGVLSPTFPFIFMDYAQVKFILAEAAARNIGGVTDAAGHYADAIEASMNFWGIEDEAVIDGYIAANPYNPANFRQSIGVQKWIALYTQGTEGWTEFRRLDFTGVLIPAAAPIVKLNTPSGVPLRTAYPTNEATLNGDNYKAAISKIGVSNREEELGARLWWDVN